MSLGSGGWASVPCYDICSPLQFKGHIYYYEQGAPENRAISALFPVSSSGPPLAAGALQILSEHTNGSLLWTLAVSLGDKQHSPVTNEDTEAPKD